MLFVIVRASSLIYDLKREGAFFNRCSSVTSSFSVSGRLDSRVDLGFEQSEGEAMEKIDLGLEGFSAGDAPAPGGKINLGIGPVQEDVAFTFDFNKKPAQPAGKPAAGQQPAGRPAPRPAAPGQQPAGRPAPRPAAPGQQPTGKPAPRPAGQQPAGKPTQGQPGQQPAGKPMQRPAGQQPGEKPQKPTDK